MKRSIRDLSPQERAELETRLLRGRGTAAKNPSINRRDGLEPPALSFSQQRLWFLDRFLGGSSVYNIVRVVRLRGGLNAKALQRALDGLVARHESLRTSLEVEDDVPVQVIHDAFEAPIEVEDFCGVAAAERETALQARIQSESRTAFDLSHGPLLRVTLLRLGEAEHVLVLVIHHIVSDGWSMGVLQHELSALYAAAVRDEAAVLPELPIQYADYAIWQREWLRGEVLERQLDYWKKQLAEVPVLELPADRPRQAQLSYRGAVQQFAVNAALVDRLRELSRRHGVTLYMVLLAAFQVLLARYSGQEDIAVGSPIAGRNRPELEGLIGFFVNTLVLRANLAGNPSFVELLARVREVALGAYDHQDIPFEKLVEKLMTARDLNRNPLFQVMFALQNMPAEALSLPGVEAQRLPLHGRSAKFDLSLSLSETGGRLEGVLVYATDLFDAGRIGRMAGHFLRLLEGLAEAPETPLWRLPLLGEAERHQLLVEWNQTERAYPHDSCIHQLFETRAARTPGAVAVVCGEHTLSYGELNARANRLAHHLIGLGVGPDIPVGLCVERSAEMVVGVLGILKAGGAYLPLDPDHPDRRLAFMLADTRAPVVVAQAALRTRLPELDRQVVCLDRDAERIAGESTDNPNQTATAQNLAYVIYTSGSTGQPKGVMATHASVHNLTVGLKDAVYAQLPQEPLRVSANAPLVFDASVKQLAALFLGHSLYIIPQEIRQDAAAFVSYLRRQRIAVLDCVPSQLKLLLAEGLLQDAERAPLALLAGGEAIDRKTWAKLQNAGRTQTFNLYGPTECTVDVTCCAVKTASGPPSIGRPLANTLVYVLDPYLAPAPVGVPGELYIGGDGLARGYLNRPELTADRFVANPFSDDPSARLYRTGDRVRYLPDGNIEFLGRLDHQVKVRGYRIELGEIETVLAQHEQVREAVVVVREDTPDDQRLVAYIVRRQGEAVPAGDLRGHLQARLPAYMVPGAWVILEQLPLTPNGKVDREALPAPETDVRTRGYVPPRSALEETLAQVWAEVLGCERVGIRDNFFDLGGHSLLATRVMARVQGLFGRELPLKALFESPTVEGLAGRLESSPSREAVPPLTAGPRPESLPPSFAQERLWFMNRWQPGPAYNLGGVFRFRGAVDPAALEWALNALAARHEALRTGLREKDGQPVQAPDPSASLTLERHELAQEQEATAADNRLQEFMGRPFDLACPPLLRALLIRTAEHDHLFALSLHHIATDGWSMGILVRELSECYAAALEGREPHLPALPVQYADYAVWQRAWLQGEELQRHLDYWRKQLDGLAPLELPADRPRPAQVSYRGAVARFALPTELVVHLKALAREENATLFMVLMAAFQTLLMRYSGQEDFAVGIPVAGRNRPELEGLVGFFVNTLVLRGQLEGNPPFRELLARTRETALEAYGHQDLPFEKLVEALNPARDLSRNPLFQVMFALQNMPAEALSLPGVEAQRLPLHGRSAKFDLTLSLSETGGRLEGVLVYATDLFDAGRIGRMAGHFLRLLEGLVEAPETPLWRLPLLGEAERHQLLVEWNQTERAYPHDSCIHQLFETRAARTPGAVAVVCGEQTLSYGELNARANRLAHHLIGLGVGPDILVGLCVERSVEMVVGMLGILKAGGGYLPLDPDYPARRLAFMLEDSRASLVLTEQGLRGRLPDEGMVPICLDIDVAQWARQPDTNPAVQVQPHHLAYVIYTSGSTGRPKGVMVPQRAVTRLVIDAGYMSFDAHTAIAQMANASFDATTFEVWGALLNGGRVLVIERGLSLNPQALAQQLKEQEVSALFLTTALFNEVVRVLPNAFESLDTVLFGGEACDPDIVRRCLEHPPRRLVHVYGPTESTTFATYHEVRGVPQGALTVPIGRPIANTRCYVLDRFQDPVPVGMPGELYIGGEGLARGYLNRPELTEERFIADPFHPGERLYRSGDQVRRRADGAIEFLGRLDHQVKLRGYRIEPGEIEAALNRHPDVAKCLVLLREDRPGDRRLTAYVVGHGSVPSAANLRNHLKERLPEYMLPSAFVALDALPLTPNGKVDREALPAPASDVSARGYVPPRSPLEETLAQVWAEVLGCERVGIRDNFFDLGGHSLLAVQLMSRIEQRFGRSLHLNTLWFGAGTVESQAQALASSPGDADFSPVVTMLSEGDRTPLFCIHTIGGGNLFHYSPLVGRLGHDRPVYGLQARGIDGNEPPDHSVEAMAAYCLESLRAVQPDGPYLLCGFSSGGVVAFEMARQLEAEGRSVARLFLVDTYSPCHPWRFSQHLARWLGFVRRRQFREIQERLYHALLARFGLRRLRQLRALGESHRWALWSYRPKPYPGDLVYFEAAESSDRKIPSHAGWRGVVQGRITLVKVSGTHSRMVHEPHVIGLAHRFAAFLDDV